MTAQLPVAAPSTPTVGGVRLINRVDVLQQLLAAVAAVPAGVKLSIPALRDALVSQADVLAGLNALVIAGELAAATLRPVEPQALIAARRGSAEEQPECASPNSNGQAKSAGEPVAQPPSPPAPSGAALADALAEYCAAHKLALHRVLSHLSISGLGALRKHKPIRRTIDRLVAFLAAPPPPGLEARAPGGPRASRIGGVTGAELADRLEALIAEHGLSKSRVGKLLTGSPGAIDSLRKSNPQRKTVEKVEALLANPPIEELRSKRKLPSAGPSEPPLEAAAGPATARCPAAAGPTVPVARHPPTFEEQLARVERGEVGIGPNLKFGRPDPSGTLGGVTGEINL